MRYSPTLALMTLAGGLLAPPAQARSGALWQEKSADSPTLTEVPNFAALADAVIPAVVSIQVEQRVRMRRSRRGMDDPFDFFHRYFGGDVPREFYNRGLGTGFVIDQREGLILTNNHVVENAASIVVTFESLDGNKHTSEATVLGSTPEYDVALLQVKSKTAVSATTYLGDSDRVRIGDWVMAVGNPFGLSHSVSVGIISAKERRDIAPSGRRGLYNFLQTDASINPGNSGGPLINMRGEVVGINTAINAAGSGIGFAIPINMAKAMIPQLKTSGTFTRSWIGIRIQGLDPDLAESYGLKKPLGALVAAVVPDSPAAKANIQEGDVILTFAGKQVRSSSDLPLYASMAGVGKRVSLTVWRAGKEVPLSVVLQAFPNDEESAVTQADPDGELGMTVADISPALQRVFGLRTSRGAVVKGIAHGGIAERAGLQPGDVILTLNGRPMATARTFAEGVKGIRPGGVMRLQLARDGVKIFAAMRKP